MVPGLLIVASVCVAAGLLAWLFVRRYADRTEPAEVLGLFRILFGTVLFCEVAQAVLVREVYPFHVPPLFLAGWLLTIACLTAGLCTRAAAVVNYVCAVLAMWSTSLHYHADLVFLQVSLLLTVMPVHHRLSLDAWLRPGRLPCEVSRVWSRLLVLVGVGFIYAESALWKWADPMWRAGLGVWKPASVAQVVWCDLSFLLNQRSLMLFLGYLVLVFETAFVVLIWFRPLRPWLCLIGIGLHLGIAVVFPLPWFGLVMCVLYVPLLPQRVLAVCVPRFRRSAAVSTAVEVVPPSRARRWGLAAGVFLLFAAQLTLTAGHPSGSWLAQRAGCEAAWQSFHDHYFPRTVKWSRALAGITPHGIFTSGLFVQKPWLVSVVYRGPDGSEVPLPLYRDSGLAHPLNSGRVNTAWMFIHSCRIGDESFEQILAPMTANWAARHDQPMDGAEFVVRVKKLDDVPNRWERDFLRHQLARPWIDAGTARWKDGAFSCTIKLPDE